MQASPGSEELLRVIIEAPSYTVASALMHVLAEGFVLTLFRHGEFLAPTEVEKKIFRLCMQDEARHVGYGTLHLKYFLKRYPERVEEIHRILDQGEETMFALGAEPQNIEPRLILAGGGVDRMQEGMMRTAFLHQKQVRRVPPPSEGRRARPDRALPHPARAAPMTETFPSVGWFRALADRMAAQPEKYRKLGAMDLTLVPRIVFPDGRAEVYSLAFEGHRCRDGRAARRARPPSRAATRSCSRASTTPGAR